MTRPKQVWVSALKAASMLINEKTGKPPVSRQRVTALCRQRERGRPGLVGRMVGQQWIVSVASIEKRNAQIAERRSKA